MNESSPRLAFLDGLCAIASLSVCIRHASQRSVLQFEQVASTPLGIHWFFEAFDYGVPIFFVLSGFVMTYSLRNVVVTPAYCARYALRRAIRLDPPYWASIAFALLLNAGVGWYLNSRAPQFELPGWKSIVAHLFYLQGLLEYPFINIVYWTLCIEVQFYLLLVVLSGVSQRLRISLGLLTLPLLIVSLATFNQPFDQGLRLLAAEKTLLPTYALFYLGSTACTAFLGGNRFWFHLGLALCSIRLVVWYHDYLAAGIVTALLIDMAGRTGGIRTWFAGPVLQFFGRISYSLYLVHLPLVGVTAFACSEVVGYSLAGRFVALAVSVAASIVAATAFYYGIEQPSVRLSKRFR